MAKDARIVLRTNIELTRQNFHQLINTIPEENLPRPSKDPALTNGELLMRICLAPRLMMSHLKNVVDRSWIYPPFLRALPRRWHKKWNERYVQYRAHGSTPLSFAIEFDKTCLFALKLLEEMWDQDFEKSLGISDPDVLLSENVTRREAFDYLMCYFDTYSKQLSFNEKKETEAGFPDHADEPGLVH